MLEDSPCGFGSTPQVANFTYDVLPGDLVTDHRYFYQAFCQDSSLFSRSSAFFFWYDSQGPVVSIVSGPDSPTTETSASLGFHCDDASYGFDFSPTGYVAACALQCTLVDADTEAVIVPTAPCDTASVTAAATLAGQAYAGLTPLRYRFDVVGIDGAGNQSAVESAVWEVVAPVSIPALPGWAVACLALLVLGASRAGRVRSARRS